MAYRLSGSSQDAEDLTQQTFLAAQRKHEQLRDPEKTRAWLTSILRNAFRRTLRKRDFKTFESFEETVEPESREPEESLLDTERLQTALNEMPEDYRLAVVLFYLQDLSYKQIAEELEIPIGTVMSRLSRGKQFLREIFAEEIALYQSTDLQRPTD